MISGFFDFDINYAKEKKILARKFFKEKENPPFILSSKQIKKLSA